MDGLHLPRLEFSTRHIVIMMIMTIVVTAMGSAHGATHVQHCVNNTIRLSTIKFDRYRMKHSPSDVEGMKHCQCMKRTLAFTTRCCRAMLHWFGMLHYHHQQAIHTSEHTTSVPPGHDQRISGEHADQISRGSATPSARIWWATRFAGDTRCVLSTVKCLQCNIVLAIRRCQVWCHVSATTDNGTRPGNWDNTDC